MCSQAAARGLALVRTGTRLPIACFRSAASSNRSDDFSATTNDFFNQNLNFYLVLTMVSETNNIHVAKNRKMQKTFMADGLLEERFEDVSALPLWLHVGPASAHEPRVAEKTCVWSWPELKSFYQLRPVTAVVIQDCHRKHRGSLGRCQADANHLNYEQTRQDY